MYAERHTITVTTNASGAGEGYTPVVTGRVVNIIYTKLASGGYDDGVSFNITLEATGQTVWAESAVNTSKTVAPRQATHATDGTASLYASSGEPVEDHIYAASDRVKIAVTNGGDTKTGTFVVVVS